MERKSIRKIYDSRKKEDWLDQTWGWYAIPFIGHIPRNNVDKRYSEQSSLRHCVKCDKVYESTYIGGKKKYYKMCIRDGFPKRQKQLECPSCKGKNVKFVGE